MTPLRRFIARIRELFSASAIDQDFSEEIQSHIDLMTDDLVRQGMSRDAARRKAVLAFGGAGGVEVTRESVRDARGLPIVEQAAIDFRRAARSLRKTPGFTITAGLTLALGIGVSTAVFSILDHVVLRALPYPDAHRLVSIWEANVGTSQGTSTTLAAPGTSSLVIANDDPNRLTVAPAAFVDFKARAAGFSGMAGYARQQVTLTGRNAPETLLGEIVTPGYFDVLGAMPSRGRAITDADQQAGAPPVIVISDAVWLRQFNRDPSAIGATLTLNSKAHEIIGVMPPNFESVSQFMVADPIAYWTTEHFPAELLANYADHEINVVARIAPGVSEDQARRNLIAVSEDIARRSPKTNENMRAFMRPLGADLTRRVSTSLVVITAMVGFILLIAIVNVANLFLVKSAALRREVAIRFALGASRRRVVTEMLAESLLLTVGASAVGLLLAWWLKGLLVSLAPASLPRLAAVSLDARVLGVSIGLAIITGVVFGLMPAWQARRTRPIDAMASGTRVVAGAWVARWRNALLIFEVAMSTVLLIGAGLMIRSLVTLNNVDLGFRTAGVVAMAVNLPPQRYATQDARFAFFNELDARLRSTPGVEGVAFANRMPMRGSWDTGMSIDGPSGPGPFVSVGCQAVNIGFFNTLGIELKRGRLLQGTDVNGSEPVAVVTETFAKRLLADGDPIGRRFRRDAKLPWITIVGVVSDIRRDGKKYQIDPQAFLPAAQTQLYPVRLADIAVRVNGDDGPVRAAMRAAVTAIDADQPIANVRTLDEVVSRDARDQRFQALLVGMFAVLALVLATIGVHGVVSYLVTQRTAEIGVRMALGAAAETIVLSLVARTGVRVLAGAAIGVGAAIALSRYVASLLFQVPARDLVTYAIACALLIGVAIAAAAMAARRATLIDPVKALRAD